VNDAQVIPEHLQPVLREALASHREGRLDDAVGKYQRVLWEIPRSPEVLVSLAAALLGLERAADAIGPLEMALSLRPGHADTCFTLAEAYRSVGRFEEAYDTAEIGLAANPDYLQGRMAMADALLDMGRFDEARAAFAEIRRREPGDMVVRGKLGAFHFHAGEFAEAEAELTAAVAALPNDAEANWHLASLYLGQRRWTEGWPMYTWRWPMAKRPAPESLINLPVWDGAGLAGKRIVVWSEQGLGDELMFSTCLPDLLEKAAPAECIWNCDARLAGLFRRTFPDLTLLPTDKQAEDGGTAEVPHCDVQISAGGLPAIFRRDTADFPASIPEFVADPEKAAMWSGRLAELGEGPKVGIAWRGGVLERFKRAKSSRLADWADILSVEDIQFVNLQHGDCRDELAEAQAALGCRIHDFRDMDPIADPDGQMALIAGLDLVVQTSNASAHMAGLLGVPVWCMLPYVADWRWSFEGAECLWYPSMRLFRQAAPGDWPGLFAGVAGELGQWAAARKG